MENRIRKKSNIFAMAETVHAICLILVIKVIAPVCDGMVETAAGKQVPMRCHYTSVALLFLGAAFLVNAILCAVRKEMVVCGVMTAVLSVLALLTLSSSVGMGICMNPEMACNFTAGFIKVLGSVGIVIGGISVYLGMKDIK